MAFPGCQNKVNDWEMSAGKIMPNRKPEAGAREFEWVADQALSASTQAMSQALHVPAACMQENMTLFQRRMQAYKDCASLRQQTERRGHCARIYGIRQSNADRLRQLLPKHRGGDDGRRVRRQVAEPLKNTSCSAQGLRMVAQ